MRIHEESFSEAVSAAVARIEQRTDAELVVVAARRASAYREVSAAVGGLVAWIVLLIVLFSPIVFPPWLVPIGLPVIGLGAALLAGDSDRLLGALAPRRWQRARVQRAARAAFVEQAVHGTDGRTGVLVFVAALEGRVEVLPDLGLRARLAPGALNAVRWGEGVDPHALRTRDELLAGLDALGALLAEAAPATGENPNELPDAPQVMP
ncbi:MAG: hypothetical protein H6739_13680 [Alphaproteobacteria bacterium]|nr:hypothetical protein [Alphaproteobacteria bacterium]